FEDEWRDKKDIIQSMLLHKLGQSRSIGARKCHIVVFDQQVRKHFFNSNHIDGDVKTQFSFGLVDNDGLVCVASFRKAFLNKDNSSLELARFESKLGVHIVGGLSKLIKHVRLLYKSKMMSYLVTRFGGLGIQYQCAGFKQKHLCSPRFWWTDTNKRYDRLTIRASTGLSQTDIALLKRRFKIWGTSNILYSLE